jgi:hypothetical protein
MEKNMDNFMDFFKDAILEKKSFVAIFVHMDGFEKEEMITNPTENFVKKMLYYENAYNHNLTLKKCEGIKIVDYRSFNNIVDFK